MEKIFEKKNKETFNSIKLILKNFIGCLDK
jgi:hypothetical protein